MPFTDQEKQEILTGCTQFLTLRLLGTMSEKLHKIADSEYSALGQDQYGKGGAVAAVEERVRTLLGKDAAIFMPSGTMAQQIALRIWCDRAGNNRIAFHPTCHLEIHEQGAYRELHHLEATLLGESDRLFTLPDLDRAEDAAALLIELPQREIGGQLPSWETLVDICDWARSRGIKLHMDGARLWECAPFYGKSYSEIAALFDSVYVSFYKVLKGLAGAALAGPTDFIDESRVWLRRHGGNLVSLSPNAVSAMIGLDEQLPRIPELCAKAQDIANALASLDGLDVVPPRPPTNMMHLHFWGKKDRLEEAFWATARDHGMMICRGLASTDDEGKWKMEVTVNEATLDLDTARLRELMKGVLDAGGAGRRG
jgi:threonine aldolase